MTRAIHLVCNAHIDPVWQWEWDEGLAAALATFRTAADICEESETLIFNHNEAILYQWIEEHDRRLFDRIRRLAGAGRWHIMGGWFLQPDCNMLAGESYVRQIGVGRRYFLDRFGMAPTTAINFDAFGHSRGLVQVMAKCGFDSYLCCRPDPGWLTLPADTFTWVGYDGSRVTVHRSDQYESALGGARSKVETWLRGHQETQIGLVLWGVGDHGGGPSRRDVKDLDALIGEIHNADIRHSTPEQYFRDVHARAEALPEFAEDLNPWGVGCYTSMARVKQRHRRLEDSLYCIERMAACAAAQDLMAYPHEELGAAERDLLFVQFHDILPGSSVEAVESAALRTMDHGLELLDRVRVHAFFALAAGQPAATDGTIPVLVYNSHPFPVRRSITCELQLADINRTGTFTAVDVRDARGSVPCQIEQEASSLNLDWRKRVVFDAELAPMSMSRFDCSLVALPARRAPAVELVAGAITLSSPTMELLVDCSTGLLDRYQVEGTEYVVSGACKLLIMADDDDSWGMRVREFRTVVGSFSLMSPESAARFCGSHAKAVPPVRVVEDGAVRTVIEAYFAYGDSAACLSYAVPKRGTELEVRLRVYWQEKHRMLKLALSTPFQDARYIGQSAYGRSELRTDGSEAVAQRWSAVVSDAEDRALTCVNDGVYGSDCAAGELRLSLLRSPGYAASHELDLPILPQDRFSPRIDQGEHTFRFWLCGGRIADRLDHIDREAQVHAEPPQALALFPSGEGTLPVPLVTLSDNVIQLTACRRPADCDGYVLRLFEPTGRARETEVSIPLLRVQRTVQLGPFEIKSLIMDLAQRDLRDTSLST